MSQADQRKWDEKYQKKLGDGIIPQANATLKQLSIHLTGGRCLDLACGLGGNSIYLAQKGFDVTAWDGSKVAVSYVNSCAVKEKLPIKASVQDLDDPPNISQPFDLLVDTFYLNRQLFSYIKNAIKPNGLFFMETFLHTNAELHAHIPADFKLLPNELCQLFHDWKIIDYREDSEKGLQSILVKKK